MNTRPTTSACPRNRGDFYALFVFNYGFSTWWKSMRFCRPLSMISYRKEPTEISARNFCYAAKGFIFLSKFVTSSSFCSHSLHAVRNFYDVCFKKWGFLLFPGIAKREETAGIPLLARTKVRLDVGPFSTHFSLNLGYRILLWSGCRSPKWC